MEFLTNDLRQLVISGEISYQQAESMNTHASSSRHVEKKRPKKKQTKATFEEPLRQLQIQAIGRGTGAVGDLPDDIYGILLSFCNFEQLVSLGSTCKFLSKFTLNDALWERLYLQRWKRPKPPAAGANCPRYHLTYYQLYARRIILGAIRYGVEYDELLLTNTDGTGDKGDKKTRKGSASNMSSHYHELNMARHAIVAIRHIGEGHIVTAGVDGIVNSWNLHKMACVSSLNAHDALKYQDKQLALEKKVESLDQAWKNKLMTFKFKKNMSPKSAARKRAMRESEMGEIDIWGCTNAPEDPDDDEFDGMFQLEQDGIEDSPLGGVNKDEMMQRPRTPSLTGNASFSSTSDTESLSDVSNDNVDLYGSSLDSNGNSGFCVGSLGSSPGLSTNYMINNASLAMSGGKKQSKKKSKREQKRLEKLKKKEARKASANAKRQEKEAKKLERQRKRASSREMTQKNSGMSTLNRNADARTPTQKSPSEVRPSFMGNGASPIEIFEKLPLHNGMERIGTSPIEVYPGTRLGPRPGSPLNSSNFGNAPYDIPRSISPSDGRPLLSRACSSPPMIPRSNSYTHSKRKKKKGKRSAKQNAMQQSREARVRKMKAEMEERRRRKEEKNMMSRSNSSGGDSGSENGSDTEIYGSNDTS